MMATGRTFLIWVVVLAATLWQGAGPAAEGSNVQRGTAATEQEPEGPVPVRVGGQRPSFADKQGAAGLARTAAAGATTVIASFDFEDGMGGADPQGWQSRDAARLWYFSCTGST